MSIFLTRCPQGSTSILGGTELKVPGVEKKRNASRSNEGRWRVSDGMGECKVTLSETTLREPVPVANILSLPF